MECTILVDYDDKIYTDLDSRDEKRRAKMKLLGNNELISKYRYRDIQHIFDTCQVVYLLNPTSKIDECGFAFDVVLNNINTRDRSKFYPVVNESTLKWSVNDSCTRINVDIEHMNAIYDKVESEGLRDYDWYKLFIIAWHDLYSIYDKVNTWNKARGMIRKLDYSGHLYGEVSTYGESSIKRGKFANLYGSNIHKYNRLHLDININHIQEVLEYLMEWSKYKILPYKCNITNGDTVVLVSKSISMDKVKRHIEEVFDTAVYI